MACFEDGCLSELAYHSELIRGLIFISCEIVIIFSVAIYFNLVIPQNYGITKHPLFCFQLCCFRKKLKKLSNKFDKEDGISVLNIKKKFKEKIALNDVSFDIEKSNLFYWIINY